MAIRHQNDMNNNKVYKEYINRAIMMIEIDGTRRKNLTLFKDEIHDYVEVDPQEENPEDNLGPLDLSLFKENKKPNKPESNTDPSPEKKITHFWFRNWPDRGVPEIDIDFINYVDLLYEDIINKDRHGGTVIHCSAGIGRTGVLFVILKICLDQGKSLSELCKSIDTKKITIERIHIDNAITYGRMRRMNMVQSSVQYVFLFKLFNIVDFDDTELTKYFNALFNPIITKINGIYSITPSTYHSISFSQEIKCKSKNRYGNILPYDQNIVSINDPKTFAPYDENYINASYLNKIVENSRIVKDIKTPVELFTETTVFNGDVISTQCPTVTTKQDFLRMLDKHDIQRIIMLTGLSEDTVNKCDDYTTDNTLKGIENNSKSKENTIMDLYLKNESFGFEDTESKNSEYTFTKLSQQNDNSNYTIKSYAESVLNINLISTLPTYLNTKPKVSSKPQQNTINLLKDRIYYFLYYKTENKIIPLSFCDSKIILLYIYLYDLLPDNKTHVMNLIKQTRNNEKGNNDNKILIENTFELIQITLKPHIDNYSLQPDTCSSVVDKGIKNEFTTINIFVNYYKIIIIILLGFNAKNKLTESDNKHIKNFITKISNIYDNKFNLKIKLETLFTPSLNPFVIDEFDEDGGIAL